MEEKDFFYVGTIVRKYSFKGELLIKLETDYPEEFLEKESFFVEVHNNMIPFFVQKSQLHKDTLLRVKFDEVDTERQAQDLLKKEVFLPISDLPELEEQQYYFHDIIGFNVSDKEFGEIGVLKEVNTQTPQALFVVDYNGTEILIPVNDDLIEQIVFEQKEIHLNLPEGLIDLYL